MEAKSYKCPKRSLFLLETIVLIAWFLIFSLILIFVPFWTALWHILTWSSVAVALFICLIYLPLYIRSIRLTISESAITYKSGVFISRRRYLYRERVVFISLIKTPFTPFLKIVGLKISATGSTVNIPFVYKNDANMIVADVAPEIA